jgi:anti-sigma factor RsiW
VDGEASPLDRAAVDAHLAKCPPCRDRVSDEQTARSVLVARRDELKMCAPELLKRRCAEHLTSLPPAVTSQPPQGWLIRRAMPLSIAATILLALAGVLFFGLTGSVEALAAQLAVDHVKCFQFASLDVPDADPVALGQQWAAARGWPIKVPASDATHELQLLTVRRCASTDGITAHLMYKWRGEPLSVYILNSAERVSAGRDHLLEKLGQETVIWSTEGRTYAIVARARPSELEQVAQYVKRTAE